MAVVAASGFTGEELGEGVTQGRQQLGLDVLVRVVSVAVAGRRRRRRRRNAAALTSGAAPGNVLHSSSWQWSGGFQQEGRNSRFQKGKKNEKNKRGGESARGGKEHFIIKVLWGRHFYDKPDWELEPDVLHSKAARMLNAFINGCDGWGIWLSASL